MLISVHIPKTAGSSFLAAINEHFGERLLRDYGDMPINRSTVIRNARAVRDCLSNLLSPSLPENISCIHGHFLPLKYGLLRTESPKQFIMWMRDPVERILSHYYYWVRNYNPGQAGKLHRRVVEEEWTLEHFCLSPELRNIYCRFLWGFPLEKFIFIGITEHYATDLEYLSQAVLHAPIHPLQVNANPHRSSDAYAASDVLRERIESYHCDDMQLYRRALQMREARL